MLWPTDVLSVESWILILSVLLLLRYYIQRKWNVLKQWNIPHDPPSLLNFGNIRTVFFENYFTYELECKRKYGPIWGFYVTINPRIVVHDLAMIRHICIDQFSNFPNRATVPMFPTGKEAASGLLSVIDDQWKRTRTTLNPAFSSVKLKQMTEIVNQCVDSTVAVFDDIIEYKNGKFVASDVFGALSLDAICSSAFSTNVNSQNPTDKDEEFIKQAKSFVAGAFFGFLNFAIITFPSLTPFFVWLGGQRENVVYLRRVCQKLIRQRSENPIMQNRIDLMQLMLESKISASELKTGSKKGLTSIEIIGNAVTMLIAGYETTGSAMMFLAYNLAVHPKIQSKLQAEIDQLYDSDENPSFNAINNLKFLDMCINENLRLYCPIPRTVRTAKNDITIGGLTIRKGIMVAIPIYALAHDPEHWDRPMEFRPERMNDISEIDKTIYQPFGLGPRNCIGSKFAQMETKIAFVRILRQFSFEPTAKTPKPPLQLMLCSTTRPKIDFSLHVTARS